MSEVIYFQDTGEYYIFSVSLYFCILHVSLMSFKIYLRFLETLFFLIKFIYPLLQHKGRKEIKMQYIKGTKSLIKDGYIVNTVNVIQLYNKLFHVDNW